MRWVAAITACLLLSITGAGLSIARPSADAHSIDAEVEATLDTPVRAARD